MLFRSLNRFQLLAQGVDSKGRKVGKYKESTKKRKQKKGQETEFITLYDYGDFQGAMYLDTKQIPIFIDSKDSKTPILKQKYGDDIMGLLPKNEIEYKGEVMKIYKQKVNDEIEILKEKILL